MRILFWGTPDFAVPSLLALLGEGHDVVGVVTQPDRPRGRSRSSLDPSPVKIAALKEGLPILQPDRPRGDEFMNAMNSLEPDLNVVVAYGHILSETVINTPPLGTLNIHGSLLPALRGAAPLQAAILEGHKHTGITIIRMVKALDAGPMLHTLSIPLSEDTTLGELHDQMAELGAMAIVQALALIETGASHEVEQDERAVTWAPKIDRESARLDFTLAAANVSRCVRAFDPYPGSHTTLGDRSVKLFSAKVLYETDTDILDEALRASKPGTVRSIDDTGMIVRCGHGAVRIGEVQPAGSARMSALAWTRGRGINPGDRLGE